MPKKPPLANETKPTEAEPADTKPQPTVAAPRPITSGDKQDTSDAVHKHHRSRAVGVREEMAERKQLGVFRIWMREAVKNTPSWLVSMVFHMIILLILALWTMPENVANEFRQLIASNTYEEELEDLRELETVELSEQITAATEMEIIAGNAASAKSIEPSVINPELDNAILEQDDMHRISLGSLDRMSGKGDMFSRVPGGTVGRARTVVRGYEEAVDRLTREIITMLYEGKVLVIWCFDQSESMKDDQQEIADRIKRVYTELGLTDIAIGDALATAVTSYGSDFMVHTKMPTSDVAMIREAIESVPVDPSGKEIMCQAVAYSIATYQKYANKTQRRMALILVTDESGDRENNMQYLEQTIEKAKDSRCKVYIMGREAVFGYPYAHIRWKHPQTGRPHWLRIDRGPETAFVEQVQTNGFWRRYDAFPSGYGPYEQSRLARQTGGIFFLLPSKETNIVRGDKRKYEMKSMRKYRPDLRSRLEIFRDRDASKLRMLVWGIVSDLNPYNKNSAKVIEMRRYFSLNPNTFVQQAAKEQAKAKTYLLYLDAASKLLEKNRRLCDEEPSLRWKANYDLLHAQLLAYKVRIYEYGAYLDECLRSPKPSPPKTKSKNLHLIDLRIATRKKTLTGKLTESTIKQADALFAKVIEQHPGTPWAARAQWERRRGFGVELRPYYEPLYKKVDKPIPLPKL